MVPHSSSLSQLLHRISVSAEYTIRHFVETPVIHTVDLLCRFNLQQ
jgi:hypothetical protein